ncbi:hypothetical protein JTE90_019632 [Oedothorax gibbosus]|uniref:Uncharacterized protein n=1 Tax=Oedothorax gibbosus TaxID=931172 RepID=A0AAV6TW29_9ARAC|nr:hypothetical protein JTE90_019632 [Oedothorax gibbosus]
MMKEALDVFSEYTILPRNPKDDLFTFLTISILEMKIHLEEIIETKRSIKWYLIAKVRMARMPIDGGEEEFISTYFRSIVHTDLVTDTLDIHIEEAISKVMLSFEEYLKNGLDWYFDSVINLQVHSAKYNPLNASSYIPLPSEIIVKKAVLNIQNNDEKCFMWCLIAHKMQIRKEENPQRVSHYISHEGEIQMGKVQYPVSIKDIATIERLNNLRINVWL